MSNIYKIILVIFIFITGCKTNEINNKKVSQVMDNFNMKIYSKDGEILFSVKSPNSQYETNNNIFNLKETTIYIFKKTHPLRFVIIRLFFLYKIFKLISFNFPLINSVNLYLLSILLLRLFIRGLLNCNRSSSLKLTSKLASIFLQNSIVCSYYFS